MPTHPIIDVDHAQGLDHWRAAQASRVIAHAVDEGGAGTRLLTWIALQSEPDSPWVEVPTRVSASMFTTAARGAGSKLVTRLGEKGWIVEDTNRPSQNAPRQVRLNLQCNALCTSDEHAMDVITDAILEWLEITEDDLSRLLTDLAAERPDLAHTYRQLLLDAARPGQAPQSSPVTNARAGLDLFQRGLIREHRSKLQPHYLPVPAPKIPDGGDR